MTSRSLLFAYLVFLVAISVPFSFLHLIARPDDAPISPLQRVVAVAANYFGPWAGPIVWLVDFPNAGLRSFSLAWAGGLTLLAAALVLVPVLWRRRPLQYVCIAIYVPFLLVWFGAGFFQIAAGLL
ncbi:MAG: hypothetical protein HZB26_01660 [Candidatus Hydrogenedentes bacterium]|nr:hypothetical protein [Candidatus Hydrogenedentota bacterium]